MSQPSPVEPTNQGASEDRMGPGGLAEFRPRTGTMDQWNAAYVRVED